MIIIGNPYIKHDLFYPIDSILDIRNSPSNSTLLFGYDLEIMSYCCENNIAYLVDVTSIKEAIFANNLKARYILINKTNSTKLQKIAENYMFDSKVLTHIDEEDEIEMIADSGIDGVIFNKFLKELQQ